MELFLLEDNDFGDLFITQSAHSSNVVDNNENCEMDIDDNQSLGVNTKDLKSPVMSLVDQNVKSNDYSDISEFEDMAQNSSKEAIGKR